MRAAARPIVRLLLLAAICGVPALAGAQGAAAPASKPAAEAVEPALRKPRLPRYYGRVATVDQRAALDKIQAAYEPKIQQLRDGLEKLLAARDAELRAALGAEQQKQFDELVVAARERRRAKGSRTQTTAASAPATSTSASGSTSITAPTRTAAERAPAKP